MSKLDGSPDVVVRMRLIHTRQRRQDFKIGRSIMQIGRPSRRCRAPECKLPPLPTPVKGALSGSPISVAASVFADRQQHSSRAGDNATKPQNVWRKKFRGRWSRSQPTTHADQLRTHEEMTGHHRRLNYDDMTRFLPPKEKQKHGPVQIHEDVSGPYRISLWIQMLKKKGLNKPVDSASSSPKTQKLQVRGPDVLPHKTCWISTRLQM